LQHNEDKLQLQCVVQLVGWIDDMLAWLDCGALACRRVWAAYASMAGDMARLMAAYDPLHAAVQQQDPVRALLVLSEHWGL
jgi:hypothetical protein